MRSKVTGIARRSRKPAVGKSTPRRRASLSVFHIDASAHISEEEFKWYRPEYQRRHRWRMIDALRSAAMLTGRELAAVQAANMRSSNPGIVVRRRLVQPGCVP